VYQLSHLLQYNRSGYVLLFAPQSSVGNVWLKHSSKIFKIACARNSMISLPQVTTSSLHIFPAKNVQYWTQLNGSALTKIPPPWKHYLTAHSCILRGRLNHNDILENKFSNVIQQIILHAIPAYLSKYMEPNLLEKQPVLWRLRNFPQFYERSLPCLWEPSIWSILWRVSEQMFLRYSSPSNQYGTSLVTGLLKHVCGVTHRQQKQEL
jgi:hypothetical protein